MTYTLALNISICSHVLTHWGRATHICVGNLTIIASDNGLSPGRSQAIIWTNAGILLIRPLRTNFNEILIGSQTFSFVCEMACTLSRPQCVKAEDILIRDNRWCDEFNRPCVVLTISHRGCCSKTEVCEADEITCAAREQAKSIRHVSWDIKFAKKLTISR